MSVDEMNIVSTLSEKEQIKTLICLLDQTFNYCFIGNGTQETEIETVTHEITSDIPTNEPESVAPIDDIQKITQMIERIIVERVRKVVENITAALRN